jgi:hypothetical protein
MGTTWPHDTKLDPRLAKAGASIGSRVERAYTPGTQTLFTWQSDRFLEI